MIEANLRACLEANPQSFTVDDVAELLAISEGENEGPSWWWILSLKDGRFLALTGWCDYTGWDCQSDAESRFAESARAAVELADEPVRADLTRQLTEGRTLTRYELVGEELYR